MPNFGKMMTKILAVLSTALVRKFIAHSELENLEQVVLSGHGHKLIGETAADSQIRAFIRATPTYLVSYVALVIAFLDWPLRTGASIYYVRPESQHSEVA